MKFKVNFSDNISIEYDLVNEDIVTSWTTLIKAKTVNDFCKINHYIGYANETLIYNYINRLYVLSDLINQCIPDKVIKREINKQTWKEALQIMHVHFPEYRNNENYKNIWDNLSEYNDIIHWLESILLNVWNNSTLTESSLFRITLDFNKTTDTFVSIPEDAYKLFDPYVNFGDLCLHYTHVGKHAQELFVVNDLTCPPDQFVPQVTFSASCRMLFTDNFHNTDTKKKLLQYRWNKFYNDRGGYDFWRYRIDDPKLAFGYIKIGKICNIVENGKVIPIPIEVLDLCAFRDKLVKTKVIDWEIK